MQAGGATGVKFPVTSVNGKTGDVVITFNDIVEAGGIDYDKLNEKLQDLISGLESNRLYVDQKINELLALDDPFDQYAFRTGFDYANDVADFLEYGGNDLLNTYGRCGLYSPHYVQGQTTSIYDATYTTTASNTTLQMYLFALPRKFSASNIIFRLQTANNTNDLVPDKQLWKIGIYKASKKKIASIGSLGVPDVDQYMRFPGPLVWESPLLDTSSKFDAGTPANSTYINQPYYDYMGYSSMPPSLVFPTTKIFEAGVYFVVVARENSSVAPSQSNQIHFTRDFSSTGYGQDIGNYLNLFPANADANWIARGTYLASTGYLSGAASWTTLVMTGLSPNYVSSLQGNLEWTFRDIDFNVNNIQVQTDAFTDPLDNSYTSVELYIKNNDGNKIGAPLFNGKFA
jgi:hypothetical protein